MLAFPAILAALPANWYRLHATHISNEYAHRMREYLENLEEKVDELVALCSALDKENKNLRGRENDWQSERRQLLIKNETARNKVEAMISRLKSMESGE
ncbi:MAG: TIGR02449 family protein [Pseudomonadales bacterium]